MMNSGRAGGSADSGEGSRFSFDLLTPLVEVELALRTAKRRVSGIPGPVRTVLIVDDVIANREMPGRFVARLGFAIEEAANGKEGLAQAETMQPDLILMDIMMPVMDGLEATRRIRSTPKPGDGTDHRHFRQRDAEDQRGSMVAGASAFMTKPIDQEDLLAQIAISLAWCGIRNCRQGRCG